MFRQTGHVNSFSIIFTLALAMANCLSENLKGLCGQERHCYSLNKKMSESQTGAGNLKNLKFLKFLKFLKKFEILNFVNIKNDPRDMLNNFCFHV